MNLPTYHTYYVTSKGSVKGGNGRLVFPGDVFDAAHLNASQIESMLNSGTIHGDQSKSYTLQEVDQPALPTNDSGTDEETMAPATPGRPNDAEARRALREQQIAAEKIEVLGAGPRRIENNEMGPRDTSNETIDDKQSALRAVAGQLLSVDEARGLS